MEAGFWTEADNDYKLTHSSSGGTLSMLKAAGIKSQRKSDKFNTLAP